MELSFAPLGAWPKLGRPRGESFWRGRPGRLSELRVLALLKQWRRRAYERRLLAQFGEHDRHDLALTVADIRREIAKPFWRG